MVKRKFLEQWIKPSKNSWWIIVLILFLKFRYSFHNKEYADGYFVNGRIVDFKSKFK